MLEEKKKKFDKVQAKVKQEIKLFENQKIKDLKKAIKDYVNLSIRYEKIKLQNLEKTVNEMQQPVIKSATPFIYQQQQQQQHEEEEQQEEQGMLSSSSGNSSTSKQKKRRQKQKQHLRQNYSELKKPLQSSASLPTRHKNELDHPSDCSETSGNSCHKKAIQVPSKDSESASKISLSASYDDRYLKYPLHS